MSVGLLRKIFGSRNDRLVKRLTQMVQSINKLESSFQALDDAKLQAKTAEFRARLEKGETLDGLLPEAFATVREVSRRVMGLRHFDVQMIGGMVLHQGKIAEMSTGEGKTLMSTLAAYLNALPGKPVHVVTVNDYLARRDAEWMAPIYRFLGLTVGVVVPGMAPPEKRAAYAADVVYGTNNEFGFDYLRDNMAFSLEEKVQGPLWFAIVDEVDSALIDEARTPLIISGPAEDSSELYIKMNGVVPQLTKQADKDGPGDYWIDEKAKQAYLSDEGHERVETMLIDVGLLKAGESLYDAQNIILMHHLNAALRAHSLFSRDVDYIVQNDQIVIVDEHTGRTMPGRRWSEGLHQAIEAKEKVAIQNENQTLASITFQNYFRLYDKLAGMTGTADTEAYEFQQIYGLEVVVIPTNRPCQRTDLSDLIFLTKEEKFESIIQNIDACLKKQQPVLVGTVSIETSEYLSELLNKQGIAHQVLNAKFHEHEAKIIAQAGRPGAVTIATNMAGRGTDIVLGGSLESELKALDETSTPEQIAAIKAEWKVRHDAVLAAGGLCIIGTERHESRRIDNQLRGRAGRQGDPGLSQFYLSLEDNLMRIFAPPKLADFMRRLGMQRGEAITAPLVTRSIEKAQRKVEGFHFDVRKQLLEFDDVANDQRKVIYRERNALLHSVEVSTQIDIMREDVVGSILNEFVPPNSLEEEWRVDELEQELLRRFGLNLPLKHWFEKDQLSEDPFKERVQEAGRDLHHSKRDVVGVESFGQFEKSVMLNCLDSNWKEHLASMDYLRQSVNLRGYAQKDPKQEYKREAFLLFERMLDAIKNEIVDIIMRVELRAKEELTLPEPVVVPESMLHFQHDAPSSEAEAAPASLSELLSDPRFLTTGRNDPCPCGSGEKFKRCHGKILSEEKVS